MTDTRIAQEPGGAAPGRTKRSRILGQLDTPLTSYYIILICTSLLLLIGLIMVLSASSVEALDSKGGSPYSVFINQARFAFGLGLPAWFIFSRLPYKFFERIAWFALGAAFLMQLMVFSPLGYSVAGNQNWIRVGGQSLQPSEMLKLALAIWLGAMLARKQKLLVNWVHVVIPMVPVVIVALGLVLYGDDLGTAMVLMLLVVGALFVAGVPMRMFVVGAIGMGIAVYLLAMGSKNRVARISGWLSQECDVTDQCYQTYHGEIGLATGGWFGVGLGGSRQKWSFLPEAHNDFIYAIIGEELGLLGTILILVLFVGLCFGMVRVIRRHESMFVKITTGAVTAWIIGQAFINIAVVVGLLPVIGVPLPLVSAGGSALVTTLMALGMVLSFARSEPGAKEALAVRSGVVRRSLAVMGRPLRRKRE